MSSAFFFVDLPTGTVVHVYAFDWERHRGWFIPCGRNGFGAIQSVLERPLCKTCSRLTREPEREEVTR